MNRRFNAAVGFVLSGVSTIVLGRSAAQQASAKPDCCLHEQEPPGRDLYIPYMPAPGLTKEKELQNLEQLRILAAMNKLTVELVKRRSNRYAVQADTPQLIKRLKNLAKKLHDIE